MSSDRPNDQQATNDPSALSSSAPVSATGGNLESEQHTETTQRLFTAIMASSDDAIVSKTLDGVITSWNSAAVKVFGYSPQEAIGQHITLIIPLHLRAEEEMIIAQLSKGIAINHYETVRVRKDGRLINVSLTISPIKDQQGRVVGAVKIARDITQRKALEWKLQEQVALLQMALDAFIVQDHQNNIVFWSYGATNLYGWSEQEAMGKVAPVLLGTRFPRPLHEIYAILKREGFWQGELTQTTRDGRGIVVDSRWQLVEHEKNSHSKFLEINRDITERKRGEAQEHFLSEVSKVLSSTLDYQQTLANIAQLVVPQLADWFSVDLVDADGRFELAELQHQDPELVKLVRAYREKLPIDPDGPHGAPYVVRTGQSELYPRVTDEMLVAGIKDEESLALARQISICSVINVPLIARRQIIGVMTFVSTKPDKEYDQRDLALAEEVGRRAGVALDNARLYREAQETRDQLEIIFQGVADGIIVYNNSGQIVYTNEAAAQMTGMASVEALLTMPPGNVFANYQAIDEHRQPLSRAHLTHQRILAGEKEAESIIGYTHKANCQHERWSLVKSRPIYDERGDVLYIISILHDITERVSAEQRKDEFIGMASHELKTPITSLKGFTYILKRRLSKQNDEQGLHYLSRMDSQLDKLTKLVSDLLDISRMQTGHLKLQEEPLDLDELVGETVENMQATTSTHRLSLAGASQARILGDKDRLGQVFINILANAIKYSPQADRVVVELSCNKEQAVVCIQDFGIGIDEAHQQKIFERFYQVTDPEEKTYPGLGIGLYICKQIIERHHGRIEVRSRKRAGSTFSIMLPLLSAGTAP